LDATRHLDHRRVREEPILESLVILFAMAVLDVLRHGAPAMRMMPAELPFLVIGLTTGMWSRLHRPLCLPADPI
jgi:hypothetical protein